MMKPLDSPPQWIIRLLRIAAAAVLAVAVTVWVTPVNTPGRNLVPVGCGSPASPATDVLSDYVCRDLVGGAKGMAVALAAAAAVLLLLSEMVLPRLRGRAWLRGAAVASVLAAPLFALSTASLATTVASTGADGTLIRCGTPLAPANDSISKRMCGQLAARDKSLALAGLGLSVLSIVGAGYITNGPRLDEESSDTKAETTPDPTTGSALDPESQITTESSVTTEQETTALTSTHNTGHSEGHP